MPTAQVKKVDRVLNLLVRARKLAQLYPTGNPKIRETVEAAAKAVQESFSDSEDGSANSGAPGIQFRGEPSAGQGSRSQSETDETILLTVSRDAFQFEGKTLGTRQVLVGQYARELYRQGVKVFWFRRSLTPDELEQFVRAAALRATGAAAERSGAERPFVHIGFEVIRQLSVVEGDAGAVPFDLLEYLRQRQALRRRPGEASGKELHELPEDQSEDISDLLQFFLEIAQGSDEKRQYLFNTLANPARLAETFDLVATTSGPGEDTSDEVPIDVLKQMLQHIADNIRALPEADRKKTAQLIAQAVLNTDTNTRVKVRDSALAEQIGRDRINDEISGALPPEEVARLLSAHVRLHNGTANTVSNFLEEFTGDEERRTTVRQLVIENLVQTGDRRAQKIAGLFKEGPVVTGDDFVSARDQAPRARASEPLSHDHAYLAHELALNGGEAYELDTLVRAANDSPDLEEAALVALNLVEEGDFSATDREVAVLFPRALQSALNEERYDFVSQFLEKTLDGPERKAHQTTLKILRPFIAVLTSVENIARILDQMYSVGLAHPTSQRLTKLLRQIGEPAYEVVFDGIAHEPDRKLRQFLLTVFVGFGEDTVFFLSRNVEQREWYVVRNVAYLLGQIGSETGIDALERVLYHADMRVRREVLRGLAAIGGNRAETILLRCLEDDHPVIQGLAAEWLGVMGAANALPVLREVLDQQHKATRRRRPDLVIGVVRAIANLGTEDEATAVRKLAARLRRSLAKRRDEMLQACEEAIAKLEVTDLSRAGRLGKASN
ncbi:MAG: HEAT repeat domain-containing protein [Candidatus Hydrogenedentes bacterium]|nr:HEAT repeat domain-containing protein [Candidatus Hydrogenedentota bacterium]